MSALKIWGISLCSAALIGAAVRMLLPESSVAKIVKIMLAAFFICAFLSPFVGKNSVLKNFRFSEYDLSSGKNDYAYYTSVLHRQQLDAAQTACEEKIDRLLIEQMGIEAEKIDVCMDIEQDSSISIKQVKVILPENYYGSSNTVKNTIKSKLKLNADVEVKNG